jgi:hypothetical protein
MMAGKKKRRLCYQQKAAFLEDPSNSGSGQHPEPVAAPVSRFPAMGCPKFKVMRVQRTRAAIFCKCFIEYSGMPSESTRSPPFAMKNLLKISGGA